MRDILYEDCIRNMVISERVKKIKENVWIYSTQMKTEQPYHTLDIL